MVAVGDRIPDVKVMINTDDGIKPAQTGELLVEPGPGVDVSSADNVISKL